MNQSKTLKITEKTHNELKIYCAVNKLKINDFVENLIKNKIEIKKNEK